MSIRAPNRGMRMPGPRALSSTIHAHPPPVKKMRQDSNTGVKPGMKRTLVTLSGDAVKTENTISSVVTEAEGLCFV